MDVALYSMKGPDDIVELFGIMRNIDGLLMVFGIETPGVGHMSGRQ